MKTLIIIITALMCTVSIASASDSTLLVPTVGKIAMRQEITTSKDETSAAISPTSGGQLSCPDGYALSSVKQTAQKTTDVVVYRICNGSAVTAGAFIPGYARVWCDESPVNYKAVSEAPKVDYVCRKLENRWTDAMVAGVRG